jgi:hypothetical protein
VVLVNSFPYEKVSDENFKQAIALSKVTRVVLPPLGDGGTSPFHFAVKAFLNKEGLGIVGRRLRRSEFRTEYGTIKATHKGSHKQKSLPAI